MSDDPLHTALESPDPRDALRAARALAALPDGRLAAALDTVAAELTSGSPFHQRRAAMVCGVLGRRAEGLTLALSGLLGSPRWSVREAALHALARVDPAGDLTRDDAATAAIDRSPAVRRAALELLALRPGEVPAAVAAALSHRHPRVRCRALRAAARLAPAAHVETLAAALGHSHRRVRRTAAELLGEVGPSALPAAARLARSRFDGDPAVASAARAALQRLGPHLPAALGPLYGSQNDPAALLDELTASLSADIRTSLDGARRARLERLREVGASPDDRAEARWLIGRLVALLTTPPIGSP